MTQAIEWLKAGTPAHWMLVGACIWVGVSFLLAKFPKVRANTTAELVFNYVNPKVVPVIVYVPLFGPILAAILKSLDTPHLPAPVSLDGAEVVQPRPPGRAAAMMPILFGLALGGMVSGCAGFKAPAYSTLAVIAEHANEVQLALPAQCQRAQFAAVDAAKTKPEAEAAVKVVQDRCDAALLGVEATAKIVQTARDGIKDASNGDWLVGAANAYRNLSGLLKTLGVNVPTIPGVL